VKLLTDYPDVCDHNFPTLQTDGRTSDKQTDDILIAIPRYARTCFAW